MKKKIIILGIVAILALVQFLYAMHGREESTAGILANSSLETICDPAPQKEDEYLRTHTIALKERLQKGGVDKLLATCRFLDADNRDETSGKLQKIVDQPESFRVDRTWFRKAGKSKIWLAECVWNKERWCFYYVPGRSGLELVAVY